MSKFNIRVIPLKNFKLLPAEYLGPMRPDKIFTQAAAIASCVLLLIASCTLNADEINGLVVGISDGDTLTLLQSGTTQVKIRLAEIDAPEKDQPYGSKSKRALSDLVFGKRITVKITTFDRYGRTVGRIFVESTDVSAEMLRLGAAWVYVKYARDPSLTDIQNEAKSKKIGLWKLDNPIPPWEWRQGMRGSEGVIEGTGISNSCGIKGNINRKGERIFHTPESRDYDLTVIDTSRGERWFCNEDEARQAGWRAPR